jgi:hypothetical protein
LRLSMVATASDFLRSSWSVSGSERKQSQYMLLISMCCREQAQQAKSLAKDASTWVSFLFAQ